MYQSSPIFFFTPAPVFSFKYLFYSKVCSIFVKYYSFTQIDYTLTQNCTRVLFCRKPVTNPLFPDIMTRLKTLIIFLITLLMCLASAHSASAQTEAADTIGGKELGEVTVKSVNRYIADDKSVYLPSRRDKKISATGINLLQNMAIHAISVDPKDKTVTTAGGEGVATFIDRLPATEQDLENMRTMDVARVEVYDYPKDPCFQGARHVVNFVMQQYAYGGYTKLNGIQRVEQNLGEYGISSKMVYKRMTYDVAGSFNYLRNRHSGQNSTTTYRFENQDVVRDITTESAFRQSRSGNASARAIYRNGQTVVSNTVGVSCSKTPGDHTGQHTSFTPGIYDSDLSVQRSVESSVAPAWNGEYTFPLKNAMTLQLSPEAAYAHYTNDYAYTATGTDIRNNVTDNAYNYQLSAMLQKQLGHQALSLRVYGRGEGNRMKYRGTNTADISADQYSAGATLSGNLSFGRFWMSANAGGYMVHTRLNDASRTEVNPSYFIAAGYNINEKNRVSVSSELSFWTIPLSEQGPNMVIQNQIEALQGNPDLKTSRFNMAYAQYEWLPSNVFSLSAYGKFSRQTNPISHTYTPLEGAATPVMVQTFANNGYYNNWTYGANAGLRLLNGNLSCNIGVEGNSYDRRGVQNYRHTCLNITAMATYSVKGFFFSGYYKPRFKQINVVSIAEIPEYYFLEAGWGNGNLIVSLHANNFFRTSWEGIRRSITTDVYSQSSTSLSSNYHRWFGIGVSYSFSYGRKVSDRQGVYTPASAASAILR